MIPLVTLDKSLPEDPIFEEPQKIPSNLNEEFFLNQQAKNVGKHMSQKYQYVDICTTYLRNKFDSLKLIQLTKMKF